MARQLLDCGNGACGVAALVGVRFGSDLSVMRPKAVTSLNPSPHSKRWRDHERASNVPRGFGLRQRSLRSCRFGGCGVLAVTCR